MPSNNYQYLQQRSEFEEALEQLNHASELALDTEFMRTNTFWARPGLVQIGCQQANYLIDPLTVGELTPLGALLQSNEQVKIMHSMSEDVELLHRITGVELNRVFDTQIAASFLGYGMSLGYQKLVSLVLGVELDKSETRSDWLARPLSSSQLSYAALDVEYLLALYDRLLKELLEEGLLAAVEEESHRVVETVYQSWKKPDLAYLKLRGGCELPLESQHLLKHLVLWRDQIAKDKDVPKPWVFNDATLIAIAERKPATSGDLKRIKGIQFKSLKKYGDMLLEIIRNFTDPEDESFEPIDKPVRGSELEYYRKLKTLIEKVSSETGIHKQLLGSRKMLEGLVIRVKRKGELQLPEEYQGWRKAILEKKITEVLGV